MGAGLPAGVWDAERGGRAAVALEGSPIARWTSLARAPDDPPVELLVLRRFPSSVSASPDRLVVRLRGPAELGAEEKTLYKRGDDRPSSFLKASAVLSSAAAATSMSMSRPSGSLVCRRIDAAMRDGDE